MAYTPEQKNDLSLCVTTSDFEAFKARYKVDSSLTNLKRRAREYRSEGTSLEERVKTEQKKLKLSFTEGEQKKLLKSAAMVENVVEAVRESLTIVPSFTFPPVDYGKKKGEEETAVLILSDSHAGKRSRSYNSEVFERRLKAVEHKVARLTRTQRSDHPVKKLVIIMDGDMVDGEGIYPTQAFHVDQPVLNQIFGTAIPAYVEFLTNLSKLFSKVEVHCVRGNHGRAGRFAEETSNWDIVLYRTLELATAKNKRITWDITSDWKKFVEVMGQRFLVAHGHQIRSVLNIPWYGVTTKLMRWAGSIGQYDCLVIGHYHTRAYADWNDKSFIMNGTFVTDDDFAEEVVGMSSSTQQTLLYVHPQKKITTYHSLELGGVS